MKQMIYKFIMARLAEPSTWRGIVTGVAGLGTWSISTTQIDSIIGLGLSLHGFLSVVLPDVLFKKKETH